MGMQSSGDVVQTSFQFLGAWKTRCLVTSTPCLPCSNSSAFLPVSASLPSSVAPFALSPAGTVTVSASPAMVPQTASSPVPREEPEMLMLRSTTPTPPPPSILAPRPRRQPPPPPRSPFYLVSCLVKDLDSGWNWLSIVEEACTESGTSGVSGGLGHTPA